MHFLYQGYQKCHFWYWGSRKCISCILEVLQLPIFSIGGIENAIFWYGGWSCKFTKVHALPPHIDYKVRFICNIQMY